MSADEIHNLAFDDMILARTNSWKHTYDEQNRQRLADAVTLTMRKRGDPFGFFYNKTHNSQWLPFTGKGMVTYPVVSRAIRSKTATSVATTVSLNLEAIRRTPDKEAGAEMCSSIYKFCDPLLWTKDHEATLAELGQTSRFSFIYNNYNTFGGMMIEVPERAEKMLKTGLTEYVCGSCGFTFEPEELGIADIADADAEPKALRGQTEDVAVYDDAAFESAEPTEEIQGEAVLESPTVDVPDFEDEHHRSLPPCPNCQTPNSLVLQSRAAYEKRQVLTGKYKQVDTGSPDSRIISPLLIRIDSYKAIGFKYKNADWFNFHPLMSAYELVAMIPELEEKIVGGDYPKWSESARWHYELNNSLVTGVSAYSGYNGKDYTLDELVEPDIWWISPKACHGWRSPDRYEKLGITIEIGESLEEAFTRQFGSFKGCCVLVFDEEVFIIGNEFFTEQWTGVPWRIDAQSFFPQGEESLLKLQDAATNVLSMVYAHVQRMSNPKLVVNGMMFERQDVEANQVGQIVWTKNVLQEYENVDWRKSIGYLQPADLSQAVYQLITLIVDIAKEESGVFDEMVGNTQTQETLGGRQMSLNQGLGLMTSTQQAKALAKIECVYQWLENWQKNAPAEAYQLIKGTFEEEWKPSDIAAFKKLDIRKEIFITVVQGTDVPKSQLEMEQRFIVAVNMGLLAEPNPLPLEIRAHIVKQVLGIDYDVQNYSASRRGAAGRLAVIKQEIAGLEPQDAFTIVLDINNIPTRSLRTEIVASIAQDPRTMVRQTDDHLTFLAFYTDQLNGLAGAKEPDEVLIAAIEKQMDAHRAILAAATAQAMAAQGVAENTPQLVNNSQNSMLPPTAAAGAGQPAGAA